MWTADRIDVRVASNGDTDAIVSIVNEAYLVEAFFVAGDRIRRHEVAALVRRGECLIAADGEGRVLACVHVALEVPRGYFGMLAVATGAQRRGVGRRLIAAAEDAARRAGCDVMDIKVVNLRADLIGFYEKLGYSRTGTEPYEHRPVLQPCQFVVMEKSLREKDVVRPAIPRG